MEDFLAIILAFPTVVFTVPLAISLLYWVMVIAGAIELELLDALAGLDGLADGAGESATESVAEVGHGSMFADVLNIFKVGTVPITITLSIMLLAAWSFSYLLVGIAPDANLAISAGVGAAALAASMVTTAIAVRPLANVFEAVPVTQKTDLIGTECLIRTSRVDSDFGQAELTFESAHHIIQVRCDQVTALKKHQKALIVSFDTERDAYVIEPLTPDSGKQSSTQPKTVGPVSAGSTETVT